MERCRHCRHPRHDRDCHVDNCGCVKFEPVDYGRRDARKRLWLVRVSFLTRRGWTPEREVRVRAAALTGATMLGVREARRQSLVRGTRVGQARVSIVAIPRSGGRPTAGR
jgi:hypothetical protein